MSRRSSWKIYNRFSTTASKNKNHWYDTNRFIAVSSSDLIDNLAEEIHKSKWKDCKDNLEYTNVKNDLLIYKCLCSDRNYQKYFDKRIEKRFGNTNIFLALVSINFFLCCEKVFIGKSMYLLHE